MLSDQLFFNRPGMVHPDLKVIETWADETHLSPTKGSILTLLTVTLLTWFSVHGDALTWIDHQLRLKQSSAPASRPAPHQYPVSVLPASSWPPGCVHMLCLTSCLPVPCAPWAWTVPWIGCCPSSLPLLTVSVLWAGICQCRRSFVPSTAGKTLSGFLPSQRLYLLGGRSNKQENDREQ